MPELIIIAAIDQNNGLGYQNHLLCHLHDDLKNFKKLTTGHAILMGRKTWDSLSVRPLPNRKNIILTREEDATFSGSIASPTVMDAVKACQHEEKAFIIGGAEIYKQFMDIADRLIITHIHHRFTADVYFPEIDIDKWIQVSSREHPADEKHAYAFEIAEYTRRK